MIKIKLPIEFGIGIILLGVFTSMLIQLHENLFVVIFLLVEILLSLSLILISLIHFKGDKKC